MSLSQLELSLMAFPQSWNPTTNILQVNVLLLPVGDPTAPLGSGPQFACTSVHLSANIVDSLAALPTPATTPSKVTPFFAQPPAVAATLYTQLLNQLTAQHIVVKPTGLTTKADAPAVAARIMKSLPASYTTKFNFSGPASSDVVVGEGYCCALRAQAPPLNAKLPPVDNTIAWGQVLSYALRQPVLAQYMGLFYTVNLNIPAGMLAKGGFVYFTLDASVAGNPWVANWQANADTVKSYAARIPALGTTARPLFGAVLLPVVKAGTAGDLTAAQAAAQEYDDGFAQIVHSNQPVTIDAATLEADQLPPGTDAGIQIGWDDETVTAWLNNQVDLLRYRLDPTLFPATTPAEAPVGVTGYRVDVRPNGAGPWFSLCEISGTLPFNQSTYVDPSTNPSGSVLTPMGDELWVAPAPIRPSTNDNTTNAQPSWLPLYFAQWNGQSVVLPDPVTKYLASGASLAGTGQALPPPALLPPNPAPILSDVPPLVYGNDYEFRIRLVDLTGGGPESIDQAVHPGLAPTSLQSFRRYVPPKALEVVASPSFPGYPKNPPATRTVTNLAVNRPRIGYPEALYTGVDPATFALTNLQTLIQQAWANNRAVSVPDPDVGSFNVVVEARVPANDTGTEGMETADLDGNFRVIYTVQVPFPGGEADPTVTLTLNYVDGIDQISALGIAPPPTGSTTLPIPTARDIRVRLIPVCSAKANYYGTEAPPTGPSSDYITRQEAVNEDAAFPNNPESELQAFFFQPGFNLPQLLAQELGLNQAGLNFTGASGERTVFGASGTLRHTVSADGSTLTIANQTELVGHWIVALVLDLQRDWTWTGLAVPTATTNPPQISFMRDSQALGVVTIPRVVAPAIAGSTNPPPDRSHTKIIFFDTVDPNPVAPHFPAPLSPNYNVTVNFVNASAQQFNLPITLPITTPPVQTPKLVSTGIAESPYVFGENYSETSPRQRYLWVQFDQPIADPDDTYFARVLAYGPDPILAASLYPQAVPAEMLANAIEPPLPISPEPVRVIDSGQSEDYAGLDAMAQMVPAVSAVGGDKRTFYLLPLPQGISSESLELFGFWTYEFRVGHIQKWSTAQGRYGRPLRVTGLQHPSPHLTCTINRSVTSAVPVINATAPYANTVFNGRRVYNIELGDPQTSIWFMLYAQVLQADGASWRNVLLTHQVGELVNTGPAGAVSLQSINLNPMSGCDFAAKNVNAQLAILGLPQSTPLSILAVEVLPGEALIFNNDDAVRKASQSAPEDPLGSQLGKRRILRTSPLIAVPSVC